MPANTEPLRGGCLCGALRYQADAAPLHETLCHCSMCRRSAGAPTVAWFSLPRDGLRFVQGTTALYRSSEHATRGFCARCGTQITFEAVYAPGEIDVTTASLDDPERVAPRDHTHAESRLSWVGSGDGLPQYRTARDGAAPVLAARSPLAALFGYKAWADAELLEALAGVDAAARHGALRVLNHVHVVDCIFRAHLLGEPHGYAATNTAATPTLDELGARMRDVDAWYCGYVAALAPAARDEPLRFRFTDGDAGLMSREEILLHVVTHGGYHRGAAGQLLRAAGTAPPRDLVTRFLHLDEPLRRSA